jgi:uncharacterized damage-inducible protein DinB
MKEEILNGFKETTERLIATLNSFSKDQFNKVPFEGSWTAGQVAEHLYKGERNAIAMINGNTEPSGRDPFEKVNILRSVFLDYETKRKSPEFILPTDEEKDPGFFAEGFSSSREELRAILETKELSNLCTTNPFPRIGNLTRWEWVAFAVFHSKRHTDQLKKIAEKLNGSTN